MTADVKPMSFAKFCNGREPETFLFEDELCVVFDEEVNKQAPVHFLVVPKRTIPRLVDVSLDDEKLLDHMLSVAKQVAINLRLDRTGYHVMVDENHRTNKLKSIHVFGRALHHMIWPTGPGFKL
ncbi:adenosine 5'-monophosphoramidase HINT2-like isoform X1 [Anticarsia gemmatalis]|uniref:adenosine 5'-monophosphoramidase HINT2-like isoform X1 n=1 Tax=Anticarsia gemmatalis TaxID=129554 RepID=UPI003F75A94D